MLSCINILSFFVQFLTSLFGVGLTESLETRLPHDIFFAIVNVKFRYEL